MKTIEKLKELIPFNKTLHILVVEDDDTLQYHLTKILAEFFNNLDFAIDGDDALQKYTAFYKTHSKFYDLVITDLSMPNRNGLDLCKQLVELNTLQFIIIMSAYSDPKELINLINIGVCKFIQKPINRDNFFNTLVTVLDKLKKEYQLIEYSKHRESRNKSLENELRIINQEKVELRQLALKDKLTNLYNRHYMDEYLEKEFTAFKRHPKSLCIILLDIDNFKLINDNYGHIFGDKILIDIADILRKNVRSSDVIGRWGGEEFLIVAKETNMENALILADHLREIISKNIFHHKTTVTASFGIASCRHSLTIEETILQADKALYCAKVLGKNKVFCNQ